MIDFSALPYVILFCVIFIGLIALIKNWRSIRNRLGGLNKRRASVIWLAFVIAVVLFFILKSIGVTVVLTVIISILVAFIFIILLDSAIRTGFASAMKNFGKLFGKPITYLVVLPVLIALLYLSGILPDLVFIFLLILFFISVMIYFLFKSRFINRSNKTKVIKLLTLVLLPAAAILVPYFLGLPMLPVFIIVTSIFILIWMISFYIRFRRAHPSRNKTFLKFLVILIIFGIGITLLLITKAPFILIPLAIITGIIIILLSFDSGRTFLKKFSPSLGKLILLGLVFVIGFWIISTTRPPPIITFFFLALYPILFPIVIKKGFGILFLIVYLFFFLLLIGTSAKIEAIEDVKLGFEDMKAWFKEQWDKITRGIERTQAGLTGDYFEGEVEAASHKKLGVYIEGLRSVSTRYLEGEPIIIYSNIRTETLSDTPVNVKINCTFNNKPADEIIPYDTFTAKEISNENIDCRFKNDEGQYPPGNYRARLSAEFNFETNAYIKTYFMDMPKLQNLREQNIEPSKTFGFEKRPRSIYSAGPIMIAIDSGEMPIGIREEPGYGPTIGIVLENMWNGKIKQLKNLTVITPGEINQESINGIKPDNCEGCEKDDKECKCVYEMTKFKTENQNIIMLRLFTKITEPESLIGKDPISYKSIKTSLNYDYHIAAEIGIQVQSKKPGAVKTLLESI
jgi:hypothetical protein